eukprot:SAG31_NODE_652_length_13181_cov_14.268155_5_plen_83_part_00
MSGRHLKDDTFSISALHLAIKVPYFSDSGHKNEKVTTLTRLSHEIVDGEQRAEPLAVLCHDGSFVGAVDRGLLRQESVISHG